MFEIKSKLEQLQDALEETRNKTDEENMNKNCYLHMLERMKKDFISTKIRSGEMEVSLRSKS